MSKNDQPAPRDNFSDTWTATDALGRRLPDFKEVGAPRKDRFVGLFYFLWLGEHVNGGPHDITKALAKDPQAMQKPDSPLWGPLGAMHHWGESQFGYYQTDDAFVLRKHAQMLSDAGVDVIIFDVTNQITYKRWYMALLKTFSEVRRDGGRTPQVAFLCPFWDPSKVVAELWKDLYEPGLYPELWFQWDGKPLIMANPAKIPDAPAGTIGPGQFFTFRDPQPDYFRGQTGPDQWGWLEIHPQHVYKNSRGEKEQMTVGIAQNAVDGRLGSMSEKNSLGRSYHDGKMDTTPGAILKGLNVTEQWERALKEDPRFIFITGWNEWIAGRFAEFNGIKEPVMFVDQFDQEHSRDIEPMKGGHGDSYYYQMVSYIRRYKGVRPPPALSAPKTIRLDGGFKQWADVTPEFRDDAGDTAHRDHPGYNNCERYVNNSGRNDLVVLKVARDKDNVYFYAQTREPLTPSTDPGWMMLFINTDGDHRTGWNGYNFVVNRTMCGKDASVLERNAGGWKWEAVGEVKFVTSGNELHLAIPRAALGLTADKGPLRLEFKWADNVPQSGDIADFIDQGDVAPTGRFNYSYSESPS